MTDERGVPSQFFHKVYQEGAPPWETGRPQPEVIRLTKEGLLHGKVLDVGCGTGENALYLAQHGCEVVGLDAVPLAVAAAQAKARERGLNVTFLTHDALHLESVGTDFDVILDSGLFHVFSDDDRGQYVQQLHAVLKPHGTLILLCFSTEETSEIGPRRVSEREIHEVFHQGWHVREIRPIRYESLAHPGGARALCAILHRG